MRFDIYFKTTPSNIKFKYEILRTKFGTKFCNAENALKIHFVLRSFIRVELSFCFKKLFKKQVFRL